MGYSKIGNREQQEYDFMRHLNQEGLIDTYITSRHEDHYYWTEASVLCEVRNGNELTKWITATYEHEVDLETETIEELLELINSYEVKSAEIKYLIEYNNDK
jgi:endonuclease III